MRSHLAGPHLQGVLCLAVLAGAAGIRMTRPEAAPPPALAPLGLRPPLPDVAHFLGNPEHNQSSTELGAEARAALQALIDEVNAGLETMQASLGDLARSWAQACLETGNFDLVEGWEKVPVEPGTLLVRVTDGHGTKRDVPIVPGDCAEIDVLAMDIDLYIEQGRERIHSFLAANEGSP